MDALHARYPFLTASREAVESADIDLATLVREERKTVVERAIDRVKGAIFDGRVPDPIADPRTELLSYPVARILISLIDEPVLTDRYALAEARRAYDFFQSDFEERDLLRSSRTERISLERVLDDFGLATAIQRQEQAYTIEVTAYLSLTEDLTDSRWRLSTRDLNNGRLTITQPELDSLLREAVRRRVADGLPLSVPPAIASTLAGDVTALERSLADVQVPTSIDTVDPSLFPPCITALVDRWRAEDDLADIEQFTLLSFLSTIGLDPDDLLTFFDVTETAIADALRYQAQHIHGDTRSTAYPPPSCAALIDAGGCVDDPHRCESVGHPVAAYAANLTSAETVTEWRHQQET